MHQVTPNGQSCCTVRNVSTYMFQPPVLVFCLRQPFLPNATTSHLSRTDFDSVSMPIDIKLEGGFYPKDSTTKYLRHKVTYLYTYFCGRCEMLELLEPLPREEIYVALTLQRDRLVDIYMVEKGNEISLVPEHTFYTNR